MAKIFAFVALVLLAMLATSKAEVEKDGDVLIFTDHNFEDEIKKHDKILVEFYAPWCGHCKKLAPEYQSAAATLLKESPPIHLAKIDATEEKELAEQFSIEGFPTLKWFVNQKAVDYTGGRTADEIVSWIKKRSGPASKEATGSEIRSLADSSKILVTFYGEKDSSAFHVFQETALEDEISNFVHNFNPDDVPEGTKTPAVVVYRKFDEPIVTFNGNFTVEEVSKFVSDSSIPTTFEFSQDYIVPVFQNQKDAIFLLINKKDHSKILSTYESAAKELKGKILFGYSGVSDGIQKKLGEFIGVTNSELPKMIAIKFVGGDISKYFYSEDLNSLTKEDSEDVPEPNNEAVKVVVGKNFREIVGHDNDVLLEFYAPWCGHCKSLEPKYKQLAEELKNVKGLVIAKCDATANEVDGINIQGFPTIMFFKKGSTESVEYEGEREIESFKEYLSQNSEAYRESAKTEDL